MREANAAAKQHEFVKMAMVEHLLLENGSKQKPAPNTLQEKLAKACNCNDILADGVHKPKCNLKPKRPFWGVM